MISYHGTTVLFDAFDRSHAFEGDGKCKFGFAAAYVTEEYASAAHYAHNKKRPDNTDYYVYTVEIPDKTADNCLPLFKRVPVPASILARTEEKLGETFPPEAKVEGIPFRKYLANVLEGNRGTVRQMTDKATVEAEKAASDFLLSIGIKLIEWPQGSWSRPKKSNFAVLDERDLRIIRIEKVDLDPEYELIEGSQRTIKEF